MNQTVSRRLNNRKALILSEMPPWMDRDGCGMLEQLRNVDVTFSHPVVIVLRLVFHPV